LKRKKKNCVSGKNSAYDEKAPMPAVPSKASSGRKKKRSAPPSGGKTITTSSIVTMTSTALEKGVLPARKKPTGGKENLFEGSFVVHAQWWGGKKRVMPRRCEAITLKPGEKRGFSRWIFSIKLQRRRGGGKEGFREERGGTGTNRVGGKKFLGQSPSIVQKKNDQS